MKYYGLHPLKDIPEKQKKFVYLRGLIGVLYFTSYTYSIGIGAISTVFLA
jgi:hypothetical protein